MPKSVVRLSERDNIGSGTLHAISASRRGYTSCGRLWLHQSGWLTMAKDDEAMLIPGKPPRCGTCFQDQPADAVGQREG